MKLMDRVTALAFNMPGNETAGIPWNARLIEPNVAIQWVASGQFSAENSRTALRLWHDCEEESMMAESAKDEGRFEFATEIILNAIQAGAVRCFYVVADYSGSSSGGTKLVMVPPEQFRGMELFDEWDTGFSVAFAPRGDDDAEALHLEPGMWFLWNEIAALRPDYTVNEQAPKVAAPDPVPQYQREPARPRGRAGRRAKPHGELLAIVIKRAAQMGIKEAHDLPNKVLGEWLIDAHNELGVRPVPAKEDAGRDARAIINGLHAAFPKPAQ